MNATLVRTALATLVTLAAASPLAHAQDRGFEGRIKLRLMDAAPHGADYSVHGDRLRIDVPSPQGALPMHAVVDLARRTLTTVSGAGQATSTPLRDVGAGSAGVTVQKTGKSRGVVGQACEEWTLIDGAHAVEACVVPGMAWFDPRRLSGRDVPAWSRRLEAEHAFPVSVWEGEGGPTSRTLFAGWATDVKREPIADDVFAVPRTARRR
jgi:hypothetical protein